MVFAAGAKLLEAVAASMGCESGALLTNILCCEHGLVRCPWFVEDVEEALEGLGFPLGVVVV